MCLSAAVLLVQCTTIFPRHGSHYHPNAASPSIYDATRRRHNKTVLRAFTALLNDFISRSLAIQLVFVFLLYILLSVICDCLQRFSRHSLHMFACALHTCDSCTVTSPDYETSFHSCTTSPLLLCIFMCCARALCTCLPRWNRLPSGVHGLTTWWSCLSGYKGLLPQDY